MAQVLAAHFAGFAYGKRRVMFKIIRSGKALAFVDQ